MTVPEQSLTLPATRREAVFRSVHRTARRRRRGRLGRLGGGLVRQRDGRVAERHVQGRAHRNAGPWRDFAQVERAVSEWVTWYNDERLHSALDYMPPVEYEQQYWADQEQTTQPA
ncbi:integrase core domain-containing protein [Embleya sp. NPDC055664]